MLLVDQFSSYSFNSALSYFAEASPSDISDFHAYNVGNGVITAHGVMTVVPYRLPH